MPQTLADPPASPPARSRRAPGRLVAAAVVALALVVAALAVRGLDLLPGTPFGTERVDRSTPALLNALEDLEDYHGASATFQVVVDLERDTRWVPSLISGERTTYLATGTVDGVVSFDDVEGAVRTDGRSVVFTLPGARLDAPHLDLENSRVVSRDRGVLDRLAGVLDDDPTSEREVARLAEQKLAAAAAESDLRERTEQSTREMLTSLARSLGFEQVEVRFAPVPQP